MTTTSRTESAGPADRFLNRFSRRTTSGRRFIPQIDGMRFIAIAMVVVVHVTSTIYLLGRARGVELSGGPEHDFIWTLSREGVYGVQLFFVISGFILGLPFAARYLRPAGDGDGDGDGEHGRRVALPAYYLRRLTRLEPPYLIALTLTLFVGVWLGGLRLEEMLPHYEAGLVYGHGVVFGTTNPIDLVTWSLEVEVQFYVLMPLLAFLFAIRRVWIRRSVLVSAALAAIAAQLAFVDGPSWAAYSIVSYIQYFLIGFLLVDVYLVEWKGASPAKHWKWDAVALAVAAAWLWLGYGPGLQRTRAVVFPFLALALFAGAFRGPRFARFLSNRWVYTIGGMCYSIYLTHTAAILVARQLSLKAIVSPTLGVDLLIQLVLVTPFVLIVGAAYFILVERPFMNPRWPQELAARIQRT